MNTISPASDAHRVSLVGMLRPELSSALLNIGVEERQIKMRVSQVWHWLYYRGITSFDEMTNVSSDLRSALEEKFILSRPEIVTEQISSDGTIKWLLRFHTRGSSLSSGIGCRDHGVTSDSSTPRRREPLLHVDVETVYIPGNNKGTLCVSSQVGCALSCSFCYTGTQRLVRNLTAEEILLQIMVARERLGDLPKPGPRSSSDAKLITNIVMMGMGEPLYNFEMVKKALLIASDGTGIALSKRRITLSTAGVVPMIPKVGSEIGVMLAVSLHAVRDELRDELVPLNRKYNIESLLDACRNYPGLSNTRRITFEYVMLKDVNDSAEDARELVRLLKHIPSKINIIPFNIWPGSKYECSDCQAIEKFSDIVNCAGYLGTVRYPRGRDILAACGQLRSDTVRR